RPLRGSLPSRHQQTGLPLIACATHKRPSGFQEMIRQGNKGMKPASHRNPLIALMLSVTLLFAACGRKTIEHAQAQGNSNQAPERIEVAIAPVVERTAARGIEVVGSLEADDDVTVSSQAAGNLDEITVDVGSQVRRGQTIARIDPRELNLKVAQAEAAL